MSALSVPKQVVSVPLSTLETASYEAFLQTQPDALFYHSTRYLGFLEKLLGVSAWCLLAKDDQGNLQGVLPYMIAEGPQGKVLNSLPYYGSNGGPVAATPEALQGLIEAFNGLSNEAGVVSATLIENPLNPLPESLLPHHNLTDERIGQWVFLDTLQPFSWESFAPTIESSARRNLKKAMTLGVEIETDESDTAWQFLETTHRDNMVRMGGHAKSPAFFAQARAHFQAGKDYHIFMARHQSQPVAALLLFYYNCTVEYFTPVTVDEARTLQPLPLIIYEAMRRACLEGYTRWNWGGTWLSQDGVYRFKKKWGSQDLRYRYFIQLNNPDLKSSTPEALLTHYPNFYTLPFQVLSREIAE